MMSIRLHSCFERVRKLKKPISRVVIILIGVIAGVLISGVLYATTGFSLFGGIREKPTSTADVDNAELTALAYTVLGYIKDGDFRALSGVAHPEFGVVFSPCATITLSTNKCFQAEQIAAFGTDMTLYVWGKYYGSGEPIELTVADYFAEFVLDQDYIKAPIVSVNYIVRSANALENITDVFHNVQFVDFHIPGSVIDGVEDFEWRSLRLGFEEYDGSLWLAVILRSAWTV